MSRFQRDYRLEIGTPGALGYAITPPIHVNFDITKTLSSDPNETTIRIYNLKQETREAWEEVDSYARLSLGYQSEGLALVSSGTVLDAWTERSGPDIITEISISDGFVSLRDTAVAVNFNSNTSIRSILEEIASQMGLPLDLAEDFQNKAWPSGFSSWGAAHEALHKITRAAGMTWSIQNGVLQVINDYGTNNEVAIVLNKHTGLINEPKRNRRGPLSKRTPQGSRPTNPAVRRAAQETEGWTIESLLLPSVNPGTRIVVESQAVEGVFRVESVRHSGGYADGSPWVTELEIVP